MASSLTQKSRDLVFVSYSHTDAQWLKRLLVIFKPYMRKGHLSVWADPYIRTGERWQREIGDALERTAIAVFLVSPNFLASDYIGEKELPPILSAAADGTVKLVCIPIAAVDPEITDFQEYQWASDANRPLDAMTAAKRNATLVGIVKTINQLNRERPERPAASDAAVEQRRTAKAVAEVQSSDCAGAKHRVPAQKPNFVPRPDDLERLKQAVLGAAHSAVGITGAAPTEEWHRVGLHGMGGIGKTELAVAFAHDPAVSHAFPDGIFWVTLGQKPEVVRLQARLARDLTGEAHTFANLGEGREALRGFFNGKACLLVIDDVWNALDVAAFEVADAKSRTLITTRDSTLLTALAAETVELKVLPERAALEVLTRWSGQARAALPEEASSVARECGYLPLALSLAGARKRDGTAWTDVLKALERGRLEFLDHPYGSIFKSLRMSVDALTENESRRYAELGVYPEDTLVPVESVCRLWFHTGGLEDFDTRDLLNRLQRKSLLYLAGENGAAYLSFHDLQHDFLRLNMESLADANVDLIEAYKAACTNGWASGPDDGYFLKHLPYHLAEAGLRDELIELLADFSWIQGKLIKTDVQSVLSDYERVTDEPDLTLIQRTLRLSIPALVMDPGQLPGQLIGRLSGFDGSAVRALLGKAGEGSVAPWLCPQTTSLMPPGPLLQTLNARDFRGESTSIGAVAVLSDERLIFSALDGTFRAWDLVTGESWTLRHDVFPHPVAMEKLPDARVAFARWRSNDVWVWDLRRDEIRALKGHGGPVTALAVLADGRVVSGAEDCKVAVWEPDSDEPQMLEGHVRPVTSVAVLSKRQIASGSSDHTVRVWDLESGKNQVLYDHKRPVTAVAVFPDGRFVSASRSGAIILWNLDRKNSEEFKEQEFKEQVKIARTLAALQDGRLVFGDWPHNEVNVLDLATNECRVLGGHMREITALAALPHGRVVSAGWDGSLHLWDTNARENHLFVRHEASVTAVTVLKDGRVVSGCQDGQIRIWCADTGESRPFQMRFGSVRALASLPNGGVVSHFSPSDEIRVFDVDSSEWRPLPRGGAWVAVTLDGRVVSGGPGGGVWVWDEDNGWSHLELGLYPCSWGKTTALADGRFVTVGFKTEVWEMNGGTTPVSKPDRVSGSPLAVFADGRCVSYESWDHSLSVWHIDGGESRTLRGHSSEVTSAAALTNGRIVSGGRDHTVRVWDVKRGKQIAVFMGDAAITCLATAGEDLIVAGSENGAVHILELRPS